MQVSTAANRFLLSYGTRTPRQAMVVAFSGGPDSTALLHALQATATTGPPIIAAHLDHQIDDESADRCRLAARFAEQRGIRFVSAKRPVPYLRAAGESLEAAARRVRYDFLHEVAERFEAGAILTAHHADDQAETVLLRLLFGSGLAGLAGIPARRGLIERPLLKVGKSEILAYLRKHRLESVLDATNDDLRTPRNAIRHSLLPSLRVTDPNLDDRLARLAAAAGGAVESLDRRILALLQPDVDEDRISCARTAFDRLPEGLATVAIATLCRRIRAAPPSRAAVVDALRHLDSGGVTGTDLGRNWRLETDRERVVVLKRRESTARPSPFAYTLTVPGEVLIEELSLVFRLSRRPVEPWMFRGRMRQAGMCLPVSEGERVTIRTRRPGDRIQPLGSDFHKRLKDVLIDQKMPRKDRDKLPLLSVGGKIVWIPGVTIDHTVRLTDAETAWVAEIEPAPGRNA